MNPIKKTFQYGEHTVTLETGEIARQADAAVLVNMADTVVLVTVVYDKNPDSGRDFFPLTVDYQEKTYAAGKIPGGFFRREGRPAEKEILTCRLIDRPIRPLFPKNFRAETQIICTVKSLNPKVDPEIPALIGTSAALSISGAPFQGPIGAARVGYKDGSYILNGRTGLEESDLDLVVAGTENAVLMVESEANQLSEEVMLGAVLFGHEQMQVVINAIKELAAEVNKPIFQMPEIVVNEELKAAVEAACGDAMRNAYTIADKMDRYAAIDAAAAAAKEQLCGGDEPAFDEGEVVGAIEKLKKSIVRGRIIAGEPRIDGRDTKTVRPITIRTGVLPRTHGSALFTRGETQALVVTTLGTERDSQIIDALEGDRLRNPSCCTTISRRSASVNWVESAARSDVRSVMVVSPSAASWPACQISLNFHTQSGSCPRSPSPMVPRRWPRSVAPACR